MSKNPSRPSALWAPRSVEGLLLAKQPRRGSSDPVGWQWLVLQDDCSQSLQRLRGQIFQTRRQALQALDIALENQSS